VQIQVRRWQALRSVASLCPTSFLRVFRTARRYGSKLFASWHGTAYRDDDSGAVLGGGAIDRLSRSHANSAVEEWEFYLPLFTASLPTGRLVMRRKVDGEWQYRSPTPEEEADYLASEVW
jgi:hypothetical protein